MGVYVHTYCQKSVLIVGTFHYIKNVLSYYNNYISIIHDMIESKLVSSRESSKILLYPLYGKASFYQTEIL